MQNHIKKRFTLLFLGLVFVSLIVFLVGNDELFLFINQKIASSALDFIVLKILTPLFVLLGLIPFLMLFFKEHRILGGFSLISGPLCYGIGKLIKLLFKIKRPLEVLSFVRIIGPWHISQFSFPSTTTMLAFGFAIPFLIEKKTKWSFIFLPLAFLVGFSVVYTGFHFPSDVLGGIFFSSLIVFCVNNIKNKFVK